MSTEGTALAVMDPQTGELAPSELSVSDVVAQVSKIQQVMAHVMKQDEHYGVVPGCGSKPTLLKPGAEKIGFTFRLMPRFSIERLDFANEHREYIVTCELYHAQTNMFAGSGVGSCSTMEAKYRFRTGPKELTGQPVPREYWDCRKTDPAKAQAMLGGPGFGTAKNPDTGQWEVYIQGERVEHDNPADYYNTVLKMAKKRAHVDAILTATAASDIFTQDVEDLKSNGVIADPPASQSSQQYVQPPRQQSNSNQGASQPPRQPARSGGNGSRALSDDEAKSELRRICDEIATAGLAVQTQDYVNFSLAQASDSIDTNALSDQICSTLSSFVGRSNKVVPGDKVVNGNKVITGKPVAQLSGASLQITLKKAQSVYRQLQQTSSGEPVVAQG